MLAVYRSHHASPDDGDDSARVSTPSARNGRKPAPKASVHATGHSAPFSAGGRHTASEDDPDFAPNHGPSYEPPHLTGRREVARTSASVGSGTVYGRPRHAVEEWDDEPAGHDDHHGGYDDRYRDRYEVWREEPAPGRHNGYPDDDYADADYDDHGYPARTHRDRAYDDRPYDDRAYGDRAHGDRGYDDRAYDDRAYDDRAYGDRAREDRAYDDVGYGDQGYGDHGYADRDHYDREAGYDDYDDRDWDDYEEPAGGRRRHPRARATRRGDDHDRVPPPGRPRDVMDGVRAGVRGFGELLITFGMVVLLFAGYEVWGKAAQVDAAQNALDSRIEEAWGGNAPKEKPLPGSAIARLYVPKLNLYWVVVQGVTPADIKTAPGHYPETAMAGKVGNFSVAGHRAKRIFWDLDLLQPGDKIFAEDASNWYEYQVTESKIVLPSAVEVVAPVPGKPGAKPTERFLTLTTCNPKWDNYERLIVHAKMTAKPLPKSEGRPPELVDF